MMNIPTAEQWVCLQCGYNMIGEMPDICPFCGARHDRFMAWDQAEKTYRVTSHAVNNVVSQLLSAPKLGLEHAAYHRTGRGMDRFAIGIQPRSGAG